MSGKEKPQEKQSEKKQFFKSKKTKKDEKRDIEDSFDDEQTPGQIKIYGCKLKPGIMYKTILAAEKSTAKEITKEALDRYHIHRRSFNQYVLCDVVGIKEKSEHEEHSQTSMENADEYKWIEKGLRVLNDSEMPLLTNQLWKPRNDLCRRYELRLRQEVEKTHKDTTTRIMNRNVRRFQKSRSKLKGIQEQLEDSPESPEDDDTHKSASHFSEEWRSQHGSSSSGKQEVESSENFNQKKSIPPPTDCPFLLLLRGYNPRHDSIIYYITEQTTIIGSGEYTESLDNINEKGQIILDCPQINKQHCWILRKTKSLDNLNLSNTILSSLVVMHPLPGALININNSPVTKPIELKAGDLIILGQHYIFMYKDMTSFREISNDVYWLTQNFKKQEMVEKSIIDNDDSFESQSNRYFGYTKEDEVLLVNEIFKLADPLKNEFSITFCYLICQLIEYSNEHFGQMETKKTIYKIIVKLNDVTREMCDNFNKFTNESSSYLLSIADLNLVLVPIAFWIANSLELLHFLENRRTLLDISSDETTHNDSSTAEELAMLQTSEEQMFAMLEDIVLLLFQETVFQVTKALTCVLPNILNCNPFQGTETLTRMPNGVQAIIDLLQCVLDTFCKMHVNYEITEQLYYCILFFTNVSVFNQLMEKGASNMFFKWSRGAQLRGNLDVLESWLYQNSLQHLANECLGPLNAVVDLLAMLKMHLLQSDWKQLRNSFPQLTPSQLHYILSHYNTENKKAPQSWQPMIEERVIAETDAYFESMEGAPPLQFPSEGFILNQTLQLPDESIKKYLKDLNKKFMSKFKTKDTSATISEFDRGLTKQKRNRLMPTMVQIFTNNSTNIQQAPVSDFDKTASYIQKSGQAPNKLNISQLSVSEYAYNLGMQSKDYNRLSPQHSYSNSLNRFSIDSREHFQQQKLHQPLPKSTILESSQSMEVIPQHNKRRASNTQFDITGSIQNVHTKERQEHAWNKSATTERFNYSRTNSQYGSLRKHLDDNYKTTQTQPIDMGTMKKDNVHLRQSSNSAFQLPKNTKHFMPSIVSDSEGYCYSNTNLSTCVGGFKSISANEDNDRTLECESVITEDREIAEYMKNRNISDSYCFTDDDAFSRSQGAYSSMTVTSNADVTLMEEEEYVFAVELTRPPKGNLGISLIDGMITPFQQQGVFINSIAEGSAAAHDGRLHVGDKLVAVNGVSLQDVDYTNAMKVIRSCGDTVKFLVSKCIQPMSASAMNSRLC